MARVEFNAASKAYGRVEQGFALHPTTLEIGTGEYVSVQGKSGSGKTTLINLIAGLDDPTSGSVLVDGIETRGMGESKRARWRGRTLGIVFQFYQLLPTISAVDNILLAMRLAGAGGGQQGPARARELLNLVDMEDKADRFPGTLSGGEQQRVAIARALANDPPLLLFDEPTGSVDSQAGEAVLDILDRLHARERTIIVISHDPDVASRAGRQLTLHDGQLIADTGRPH